MGIGAIDLNLTEDMEGWDESIARSDIFQSIEEFMITFVALMTKLITRESKNSKLVSVFVCKLILWITEDQMEERIRNQSEAYHCIQIRDSCSSQRGNVFNQHWPSNKLRQGYFFTSKKICFKITQGGHGRVDFRCNGSTLWNGCCGNCCNQEIRQNLSTVGVWGCCVASPRIWSQRIVFST